MYPVRFFPPVKRQFAASIFFLHLVCELIDFDTPHVLPGIGYYYHLFYCSYPVVMCILCSNAVAKIYVNSVYWKVSLSHSRYKSVAGCICSNLSHFILHL